MSDLAQRLRIKASIIELGEKIELGSDAEIMREAAAEVERLRIAMARLLDATAAHHRSPLDHGFQVLYNAAKRSAEEKLGRE